MQSILDFLPEAWKVVIAVIGAIVAPIAIAYFSFKRDVMKYRIDKEAEGSVGGEAIRAAMRLPSPRPTFDLQTANDLIHALERNTQAHMDSTRAALVAADETRRLQEALRLQLLK